MNKNYRNYVIRMGSGARWFLFLDKFVIKLVVLSLDL